MRKPFVAGNWKMNKTMEGSRLLVAEMLPDLNAVKEVDRVLCPPYIALQAVSAMLAGSDIGLGAQNMHWEASGAYTGEIAPPMVAEVCQYVILGHSERRTYFGESDAGVRRKVVSALAHGLTPIVCVGETLEENEGGRTAEVVSHQLLEGLGGLEPTLSRALVVAYEPVWAIGTGRAATAEGANAVIRDVVRPAMAETFGSDEAQAIRVLYGGSVNAANAREIFTQPEIDGGLIGGASLKASEFVEIVRAAIP